MRRAVHVPCTRSARSRSGVAKRPETSATPPRRISAARGSAGASPASILTPWWGARARICEGAKPCRASPAACGAKAVAPATAPSAAAIDVHRIFSLNVSQYPRRNICHVITLRLHLGVHTTRTQPTAPKRVPLSAMARVADVRRLGSDCLSSGPAAPTTTGASRPRARAPLSKLGWGDGARLARAWQPYARRDTLTMVLGDAGGRSAARFLRQHGSAPRSQAPESRASRCWLRRRSARCVR
jgi:hypothetical protein